MSAATSWVDVANSALIKLGEPTITSLEDTTLTARLIKSRLNLARNYVLRKYPFNSARKSSGQLAPLVVPITNGFSYAFQIPTDLVRIVKIIPGFNSYQQQGDKIYCDENSINIDYVYAVENPTTVNDSVLEAIACYLASELCYKITESLPLKESLQKDYRNALVKARNEDASESYPETWEAIGILSTRTAGTVEHGPYGNDY